MILKLFIALIALEHVYFLVLEMFLWRQPIGRRIFGLTPEFAEQSASLAANQGLYNGFLVAGLVWSLVAPAALARPLMAFFLGCVLVAGLFGGVTVKPAILVLQALPAAIALGLWFLLPA